ncbi:helix-turn-helix domain-containing protein [Actinophytocola xanthii]|uniref:HTH araC/xylS-type domain-containing protein n=1 Tax=Actinophytocola xanthii TaxID=1912961 RepID=A0A1Q8C7H3_9PSEU|nr:AraC family transcriptional regulator [Actinophytocola xanthii]OLF10321.1 hypothetical protein BU204_31900 [Actinophytocola xanthii]
MDDVIEKAVERVIRSMHANLGEPITIDDMARTAMFSKFHFSRIFQRVTGISPGRFLSALRLQRAKYLLLTTDLTVADISHVVGYNSIGTFSSRFRTSVGVSPTEYRQHRGCVPPLAGWDPLPKPRREQQDRRPSVRGRVWQPPACRPGRVVVGLFPDRIAQGTPVRHTTLPAAGEFVLEDVPPGTWHLLAHSMESDGEAGEDNGLAEYGELTANQAYVGAFGLDVASGRAVHEVDVWLRARRIFDPPALLAQVDAPMWTTEARAAGRVEHAALPGA